MTKKMPVDNQSAEVTPLLYAHHMSQSRLPRIERRIFIYGKRFCKKKRQKVVRTASISKMKAAGKYRKSLRARRASRETEALLRKAIADYEEKKFVAKADNITRRRSA